MRNVQPYGVCLLFLNSELSDNHGFYNIFVLTPKILIHNLVLSRCQTFIFNCLVDIFIIVERHLI